MYSSFGSKESRPKTYKIGSYEIFLDNRIGVGAYASVYIGRCVDPETIERYGIVEGREVYGINYENIVAVKKVTMRDVSVKVRKAIFDEVAIMRKIRDNPHENIVRCYDVIDDIDCIYIVMEYCDSSDLHRMIGGKPMSEQTARFYFAQLINGMKYLNASRIMHRDIKPKNILLTAGENGIVLKICDFGLAKEITTIPRSHTICGSPMYMAPELFNRNKNYDETIDIWSIGIILFEMLYGYNPFHKIKDRNELELFMINEEIRFPTNTNLSKQCTDVLHGLLQKNVTNRITFEQLYDNEWINGANGANYTSGEDVSDSDSVTLFDLE